MTTKPLVPWPRSQFVRYGNTWSVIKVNRPKNILKNH